MADTNVDFDLLIRAGGPVRSFKAGHVVFREGDSAVEFFVIKSGMVEIRIRDRLISTLGR
jgi:CRP-like cAMP-binding protein